MFISDVSKLDNNSDVHVKVCCDSKSSTKCKKIIENNYSLIKKFMNKNNGIYICDECNNNVINYDEDFFNKIDDIEKAYLLGVILSNIRSISNNNNIDICNLDICIYNFANRNYIKYLLYYIGHNILIENEATFLIKSERMLSDIYRHLNIEFFNSTYDIDFTYFLTNLKDSDLQLAFIRAYIENNSSIIYEANENCFIRFIISSYSENTINTIKNILNIPSHINKVFNITYLYYYDVNIIDMLGLIYKKSSDLRQPELYDKYLKLLNNTLELPLCKVLKSDENAFLPGKTRVSDVGYDLTIIKEVKRFNSTTVLYDTGIKIMIEPGYYVEVVPRSSISKSGYIVSNSIGIIDQSYRGNIMVSLTKIAPDAPDIVLPFKCCQLIFKKQIYADIIEVNDSFDITDRNEGGYGSTSK